MIDAYSRRIVGWRAVPSITTAVVLDAPEHAVHARAGDAVTDLTGLISHSAAGGQGGFNRRSQHLVV